MLVEYHKIKCPFKRSVEGNKEVQWNDWIDPTIEYLKNNKWVFTEKVDGTNIRIFWDGHSVTFAGRTDRAQIPAMLK